MGGHARRGSGLWVMTAFTVTAMALSAACRGRLPEADSPEAKLYVAKCNDCHVAYNPVIMTAGMWQVQVARMEANQMRRAGMRLSAEERRQILDYLVRNAGKR